MVVAIDGREVVALDLERGLGAVELMTPTGEERGLVEVLLYASSLAELGLPLGRVAPFPPGAGAEALPTTDVVYRTQLEDGEGWTLSATPSAALAAFRWQAGDRSPCHHFRVENEVLPTGEGMGVVAPAWHQAALVSSAGQVWIVEADRTSTITVVAPAALRPQAAALDVDEGTFVIGGFDGELYAGRLEGTVMTLSSVGRSLPGPMLMASGSVEGRREIFILSVEQEQGRSTFGRFFDGQWTIFHEFEDRPMSAIFGGLERIGPGEAIAARVISPELVRWSSGTLVIETPAAAGLSALARIPGLGELAGTSVGRVMRRDGPQWMVVADTGINAPITALAAFEDGFLFGNASGAFGYFTPAHGVCLEPTQLPNSPTAIIPLASDTWLLAGERRGPVLDPVLARVTVVRSP